MSETADRRPLEAEPAYIDPVTGARSDAHLHAEILGADETSAARVEAGVARLVQLGVPEVTARSAFRT